MMGRKQEIFESVLTSAYDHNRFVDFSREIITGLNLKRYDIENKPYNTFSNFIARYFQIGDFTDPEDNTVGIFSVELKRGESVERARTAQRTFVKRLLENGSYSAALVAFYSPDTDKWRFSFVRMDYEFAKGKIKESLTPARRYSYLVGKGEPCHTAMDRLLPIFMDDSKNPTIDEIEESFSVEKVTKDFFEAYKEKYLQLADYLNNNEDFVRESNLKHFTTEQFTKKLLSQIVFLYFIQKKGWLGVSAIPKTLTEREYKNAFFSHGSMSRELVGKVYYQDGDVYRRNAAVLRSLSDEEETEFAKCVKGEPWGSGPKDFMRRIFENAVKHDHNFFDDCLEPLFYTGLNQDRGDNAFFPPLHCRIPFLNGGLFEELEHYEWRYNDFDIPNEIFSNADIKGRDADGILDIFDRYNFTMAEDEPLEKEVAVDPEMLGKVFENLLEVKDRKSKGAFYTPREIVHYMCSESLINYLTTNSGIPEDDIRKFITLGEFFKDDDARKTVPVDNKTGETVKDLYTKGYHYEFDYNKQLEMPATILDFKDNVNRIDELDRLLADVRVVDPAVGSGAFPLGLLNEIVKARDTLTTYMAIPLSDFKRKMLYVTRSQYQLKTETIKNCIFACDIEPSAADITKLRLWLSLVIEDEIGEKENDEFGEHTKPRKLPNLDCNVLCGNSLISSFEGIDLICNTEAIGNQMTGTNRSINDIAIESHINGLIELQNQLYSAETSTQKEEIKKKIQVLYDAIIVEQLQVNPDAVNNYLDIRNANSKPFILWQLYFPKVFKDKGGFDICIGNPPYIGESGHKDIFRAVAKTAFGKKHYQGKMDYFYFFFNKGLDLLKAGGNLALITTNYYPTASGARKLRKDLKERSLIRGFVNFNEIKVFESALGQHNMITMLTKKYEIETRTVRCKSIVCNGDGIAVSDQIRSILNGEYDNVSKYDVDQDNLYDGEEDYIRLNGVAAQESNSIESVLNVISKLGKPLSEYAEVNQGVLTGCDTLTNRHMSKLPTNTDAVKGDGIFVLDMEVKRDVLECNDIQPCEDILKDFYKNSDISRYYSSNTPTKKLIYYSGALDKDRYPGVYKHMLKYRPILEERLKTYNEHYHWTAIHRPRNGKVFEKGIPKIVVPYRSKVNAFAYNEIEWFCRSDCYVITSKTNEISLKALLALLNSDTYYCWMYYRGKRKGETLELFQKPLSETPIALPEKTTQEELEKLVDLIIEAKRNDRNADTLEIEDAINKKVYSLFDFSNEEIELIRNI